MITTIVLIVLALLAMALIVIGASIMRADKNAAREEEARSRNLTPEQRRYLG